MTMMMRMGKRMGLAAAAALVLGGAAAQPASAALVYDLRLTSGGGKSITTTPGGTFQVDVFAVVTGANGTATDDGFTNGFYSLLSNNASSGSTAGFSITGGGNVAPFNSGDQDGFLQDIDGDGDVDAGKKAGDPGGNARFIFSRTGTTGGESGVGTGAAEFKLATYDVLVTAGLGIGSPSLNVVLPGAAGTGTVSLSAPVLYKQDGAAVNSLAAVSVGTPVTVVVPEPAAIGLMAAAGGLLALRRRRRSC
jgi:hypothetical protein